MIGVEHHDEVGPGRRKLLLLRAEQLGDLAIGAVALDEMRKDRGVRHAEPGDDLRHDGVSLLRGPSHLVRLMPILAPAANRLDSGRITCRASRSRTIAQPEQRARRRAKLARPRAAAGPAGAWPLRLFADRRPAARCAGRTAPASRVWVIPNIEHFLFDRPSTRISRRRCRSTRRPQLLLARLRRARRHLADDGDHGGYGVRGTVALNSDVCREYPRIIEEGKKLGWEWMGHGTTNSTLLNQQSEAEERALINEVVDDHRQQRRQGAARLAQPGAERDRAHARHPRRERHRIRRQLGQRRPALSDEGEERAR